MLSGLKQAQKASKSYNGDGLLNVVSRDLVISEDYPKITKSPLLLLKLLALSLYPKLC